MLLRAPRGFCTTATFDSVSFLMGMQERGGLDYGLLGLEKSCPLVVTGYGRAALPSLPGISEIRAHFMGAKRQTGLKNFTLVELGGQDSKMVHVENGRALDFMTNRPLRRRHRPLPGEHGPYAGCGRGGVWPNAGKTRLRLPTPAPPLARRRFWAVWWKARPRKASWPGSTFRWPAGLPRW